MFHYNKTSGIHTFELQANISFEDYQSIRETLCRLSAETSKRFFPKNNFQKYELYADCGLSIFLNAHFIKLVVNASRLIDPDNILGLYRPENAPPIRLLSLLSGLLETFLPDEISAMLSISRIDYTIDSFLPSDEHVLLLIKLAKKNGLPRGFMETYSAKIQNSPDFNRHFSYNASHTSGSCHVTLYAKHKQLFTRKNIPQNILSTTDGLLRAEISCVYPKNTFLLWQPDEWKDLFYPETLLAAYQNVIPQLFPYGIYLKSPLTKNLLEKQYSRQRSLKKNLLKFLDNVITSHSFHKGYILMKNKNIPKKILLDAFYTVGVNPVTIAVNDKISLLPSIYCLLGLPNPYDTAEKKLLEYIAKTLSFSYD